MQLKPQEQFAVVRQLSDPFDSGTYYVQAKIRNAHDDTLLATLNLSDKTGQRFRSDWQVPADVSGEGFYIDIETIVYTDSGYTTVSDVYGRENAVYLVQERQVPPFGGGGGDVSYDKIGAAVRTALKADREEQEPAEKPQKVDLEGTEKRLLAAISGVLTAVEGIDVPDHAPALKKLAEAGNEAKDAILAAIEAKPVTEKTDLAPVIQRIDKAESTIGEKIADLYTRVAKAFSGDVDGLREVVQKIVSAFNGTLFMVAGPRPKDEKIEMPEAKRPERNRRIPGATRGFISLAAVALIGAVMLVGTMGYQFFNTQPSEQTAAQQGPLGDTVNTLPQFTSTTSPSSAITQRTFGKDIRLTGYESLTCLGTDSNGMLQLGTCSGGGGGSGGGTWSTTTSQVAGRLINYPNNTSDIVVIGSNATTSAEFYYDPNTTSLFAQVSSSTLAGNATTTGMHGFGSIFLNSERFTDLTGAGLTLSSGALTVDNVTAAMLNAEDFGSFTCNGTTCTIDSQAVSSSMLANADFGDFTCSGGSCTVDANAITLGTDTTGNYVATVTSSGSITVGNSGSETAAVTVDLNMANANSFTALQSFANASSSLQSVLGPLYVGRTATTTIGTTGSITMPSGSSLTITGTSDGCATFASGVLGSTGSACGSGGGGTWPFTPGTYNGQNVQATSTALRLTATPFSLFATSTFSNNATTSQFTLGAWGATAGIYFTEDGDGAVTIQGIGNSANESITINLDDTANAAVWSSATGITDFTLPFNITLADDKWVGLGSAAARVEFDDQTTDEINFLSSFVGVATSSPWGRFAVTGSDTGTTNALIVANSGDTPLLRVQNNGTTTISGITAATSTVYGFSTAAGKGATIILEDTDGAGCTEVYALNGVLTAATVTCPAEN